MAEKKINRELSIYINDRQVINSLGGVTREITKVNAEMRNLNKNSATYDADLKKLQGTLSGLKDKQAAFKEEIHATNQVAGQGAEAFSKLFIGLSSGNLDLAKEGLQGIRGGLEGMVKSAMAFIATPIGAAIAVLSGIAIGTKAIFDFNVEAEKSARLIENLSGKTGQVVEDIRVKINALTDTFGVAFDGVAKAVDNLVDTGVAKDELEALEQIKNGLLTAPDKNEFISSLENTAVAAKQIGADLETVIALKQAIETTGVDPEKTFGALQKAGQNLAIQNDVLRKSFTNAFGAAFTDDILAKVKTGQITTVQALDAINKKSKEVGLNQTQQAELTKEIFGKAGLAAGGYAVILDTVSAAQKKQGEGLNENQKALQTLTNANERLGKAQSDLFRIEGFGSMWDIIKAKSTDALSTILEYVSDLKKDTQPLIDLIGIVFVFAWENFKQVITQSFAIIGGVFRVASNAIKTFVDFFKALITGDFSGALTALKNGFFNLGAVVKNTFGAIYNSIITALQGIVSAVSPILSSLGIDVDKLKAKLEGFKSKDIKLKTTTENKGTAAEDEKANTKATQEELAKQQEVRDAARKKEEEARAKAAAKKKADEDKAAKEELDRALALAKAKADLAKAELDYFIVSNRSKIDNNTILTQELINQETQRLESIQQKQLDALQVERETKLANALASFEQGKINQDTLNLLKYESDLEYETARQNLELGFQQSTDALKKQYEEQQKQLTLEQLALDNELELANADTKAQEDAIKVQQQYDADILRFRGLLEKKKITQAEYDQFAKDAKDKKDALDRTRELNQLGSTLGGLSALAGAATQLFGQSREMALVSAGINGAQAITSILAQWPKFDGGFSMYAAIAAAGITTIAQIANIQKAKAPKQPRLPKAEGFYFGGDTGSNAALGFDQYGPVTGVVHQNEWVAPQVMTQSPRYAPVLNYLENERKKILGNKFADGGAASPGALPNSPGQNPDEMTGLLRDLRTILSNGIMAKLLLGYEDAEAIDTLIKEGQKSTSNGTLNP